MARLFGRHVRLTVAKRGTTTGTSWTNLHITASISKTPRRDPNTAEIVVYNLSKTSRALFDEDGLVVMLQAGYTDPPALVFVGDIEDVEHSHKGPDWVTTISAGDGENMFNRAHVQVSIAPDGTMVDALRSVLDQIEATDSTLGGFGLEVPTVRSTEAWMQAAEDAGAALRARSPARHGYSFEGRARDALNEISKRLGITWSVQDGRLQFIPLGGDLGNQAIVLNPSTGLIGSPVRKKEKASSRGGPDEWTVTSLLHPGLVPGAIVRVESVLWTGFGVAGDVDINIDSHGSAFHADVTVEAR